MTMTYTAQIEMVECADCAMAFGVPARFLNDRRRDLKRFHCPSGHVNCYAESTTQKLERELAAERARHDQTKARAREAEAESRKNLTQARTAQTKARKLRQRAKAGKCPCCHEHFPALERHMHESHPGYGEPAVAKAAS